MQEMYHFKYTDKLNGSFGIEQTFCTKEYIQRHSGELLLETKKIVDPRLISSEGKAVIRRNDDNWAVLKKLEGQPNQREIIGGNNSRKHNDVLVGGFMNLVQRG